MSEHTHAQNTTSTHTHTHKVRNAVLKNKQNQQHSIHKHVKIHVDSVNTFHLNQYSLFSVLCITIAK